MNTCYFISQQGVVFINGTQPGFVFNLPQTQIPITTGNQTIIDIEQTSCPPEQQIQADGGTQPESENTGGFDSYL